jgi:protein TonB
MTTPLPPTCPIFHRKPGRGAALGWSASASVVALALSGLAALAMSASPSGESSGEDAVQVLLLPSAPAIAAQNEPAPVIAAAAPSAPEPPAEDEVAPDLTPTETTAPTRPDPAPTLPDLQDDAAAKADLPPTKPAELAEADAPETPAVEPVTKPKPKADKPPKDAPKDAPDDLPKPKKTKTASADAASEAAAPKAAAAESAGSGAKATANYGSAVMKKIRKTKKQRAPAKGTVVVGFAIAADGGLASVKVLQSSGSSELDQVALDHIRRSAPFPQPPPGADRKFSFEFVGKG